MTRAQRKLAHINHALSGQNFNNNLFSDIKIVNKSIPESDIKNISLKTSIQEINLSSPIIINAMTGGGGKETYNINKALSEVASETQVAMAVGSQMSAIKEKSEIPSYKIVRDVNKTGILFANLGSEATVEQAKIAVDMIEANALQIHLNVIQELVMPEGDRSFTGALKRIEDIVSSIQVPVIIKEVGFGISGEIAKILTEVGVKAIDVGGYGGTNFSKIENKRRTNALEIFDDWGIRTPSSIAEVRMSTSKDTSIISSGGLKTSLDVIKSIALGASATGFAGDFLFILKKRGAEALRDHINNIHEELKLIMTATGASEIYDVKQIPIVITGDTYHWLSERGYNTKHYSTRKQIQI